MTGFTLSLIVAVLCVFGLADIMHSFKQRILRPKKIPYTKLVVYLSENSADLQLASVIRECNWYGKIKTDNIIVVYSDLSDEELESCKKVAERYNIPLYSLEQFNDENIAC